MFCGLSAIISEICGRLLGVSFKQYRLSTLACYSPADSADHAEECSKLHYFAEKDSFVRLGCFVVLLFVCVNLRDLREALGFLLCILIE